MEKYAALGVPYYVIYNPFGFRGERILKAYQRHGLGYLDIANPYLIPELGLGLTTWEGSYQGCQGNFLRFLDAQGKLLLTADERANQEHARADRLAQKLKDLGIDPDAL